MVVDNRAGAGGVTGVDVVAKAAPDGYTFGIGSAGGLAISPKLDRGTPYDPLRDLAPITLAVLVPGAAGGAGGDALAHGGRTRRGGEGGNRAS